MEALKRELQVLSEQYSQKCLEIGALTRQAEEREHTLRRCQQEGQELLRHNQVGLARVGWGRAWPCAPPPRALTVPLHQELHARLSEEIDRLRGFIASQGTGDGCGRSNERSSCELEVSSHPWCQAPGGSRACSWGEHPDRLGVSALESTVALRGWAQQGKAHAAWKDTCYVPSTAGLVGQKPCSQSPALPSRSSHCLLCDRGKSPHVSAPGAHRRVGLAPPLLGEAGVRKCVCDPRITLIFYFAEIYIQLSSVCGTSGSPILVNSSNLPNSHLK